MILAESSNLRDEFIIPLTRYTNEFAYIYNFLIVKTTTGGTNGWDVEFNFPLATDPSVRKITLSYDFIYGVYNNRYDTNRFNFLAAGEDCYLKFKRTDPAADEIKVFMNIARFKTQSPKIDDNIFIVKYGMVTTNTYIPEIIKIEENSSFIGYFTIGNNLNGGFFSSASMSFKPTNNPDYPFFNRLLVANFRSYSAETFQNHKNIMGLRTEIISIPEVRFFLDEREALDLEITFRTPGFGEEVMYLATYMNYPSRDFRIGNIL